MPGTKAAPTPKSKRITKEIRRVRKVADRTSQSTRRFAEYKYLRAVFRAYHLFAQNNLLNHLTVIAPSELMTVVRANCHPIRIIIDATCSQHDLRLRSRWTRALAFAAQRNVASSDLLQFIKANGGISGCADLASKTKAQHATHGHHGVPDEVCRRWQSGAPLIATSARCCLRTSQFR